MSTRMCCEYSPEDHALSIIEVKINSYNFTERLNIYLIQFYEEL